jgi:FKBP-type peptidyl-prolyl cis-trans isomerase
MKPSILPLTLIGLACMSLAPVCAEEKKAAFTMTTETPADVKAAPEDAEKTASGLASKVLKPGTGTEKPVAADTVTVHYSGWTTDGKLFDSSVQRGEPTSFPLSGVIKGWTEGLQLMTAGEIRRFWIPADLAYGDNPGGGQPSGTLVFDVELISIKAAPKAPADVKEAPADAVKTASGLATKIIAPGTGSAKPTISDNVSIHYSGWTTDGKLFDSSIERGEPATFPLNRVFSGLQEGLQLMVEGEKLRLWIPADLAYGNNPPPSAPKGMLVFDVELLKIVK